MQYTSTATNNINPRYCLLNKVAVPLLSVKQCTVANCTADGCEHFILDMKPHEAFPCSADSLHC
jgi:hypothetical protein